MAGPDVSACLIVKDAQATLPRCLESILDLVNELIVVDTGSSDSTKSQAESYGCRVSSFPWTDDFSAARNESLRQATGRWILCLDADEYFDEPNRQKLRGMLTGLLAVDAAYTMTQRSLLADGSPLDLLYTRLFRNHPAIRWKYRVHEQIAPSIHLLGHAIYATDIVIHHSGYQDRQLHRRKVERNARLLELDLQDHPNEAFVLLNLGTAYADLGRAAEGIALLRQSLRLSPPEQTTARDAYVALLQCHRRSGQGNEAWAVCLEGRRRYPREAILLFWQAQLLCDQGNYSGAEQCLLELIQMGPGPSSGGVAAGLRQYVAPHTLGLTYVAQGRIGEAEKQWKTIVVGYPFCKPSWQALAELYLSQQRWTDLEAVICQFEAKAEWAVDGAVLRARRHLANKDFVAARTILERLITQAPDALPPRFYLTHVLMAEGKDWRAAERALRELLRVDQCQAQGWHNLAIVLHHQNRSKEALQACETGLKHCPGDPNLSRLHKALRGGN